MENSMIQRKRTTAAGSGACHMPNATCLAVVRVGIMRSGVGPVLAEVATGDGLGAGVDPPRVHHALPGQRRVVGGSTAEATDTVT